MTEPNNKPVFKETQLLRGADAIKSAIDSIQRRGKKLDMDIQIAAVSALLHHSEHGDTTLVNRLVAGMPNGSRVNALRDFIQTFGGVSFDEKSKLFVHAKGKNVNIEGAMLIMWTEFKPEPAYVPFDAMAALDSLLARVKKADTLKGDKVPEGFSAKLEEVKAALRPEPSF